MVASSYESKILEWADKPPTNKQTKTHSGEYHFLFFLTWAKIYLILPNRCDKLSQFYLPLKSHIFHCFRTTTVASWQSIHLACGRSGFDPWSKQSLKQVVTAPLPNLQQQMQVPWVLGDDHYKGLARATVGVAR